MKIQQILEFNKLDLNKIPYFVFIGTNLSYIDGISPRISDRINWLYRCIGNTKKEVNNRTLADKNRKIQLIDTEKYQIIGIDCMVGIKDKVDIVITNGIKPRAGLEDKHDVIGDVGIGINVSNSVNSIYDFLHNNEVPEVKELEDRVYKILISVFMLYSEDMRMKICEDNRKDYDKTVKRIERELY